MEAVVERERMDDDAERIGAVLVEEGGESAIAVLAKVELDVAVFVFSLPFLRDVRGEAVGAFGKGACLVEGSRHRCVRAYAITVLLLAFRSRLTR